jgi:PAS domain S-box-containing protein
MPAGTAPGRGAGGVRSYGMPGAPPPGQDERSTPVSPPDTALRLFVESLVDYAIVMLDPGGRVVSWNAGAQRLKGYRAEEIIGQHFSVFYPPEDVAAGKPDRELEVAVADGRLADEGWRIRADGTRFWANVVINAVFDEAGTLCGFGKVTRELTERRVAGQEIADRRRLLADLVEAQERERRRIAWDVHDDTIQAMVAVGMRLQLLTKRAASEQATAGYATALGQLDEAVRATTVRLRNLIFRLRPLGIERTGIADSLGGYLAQVVTGWGLTYSMRHQVDREPPDETAITVFRIVQEALTNVRRHAHATCVELSISSVPGGLAVQVVDDGIGTTYPVDQPASHEHFGLIEMRERAETAGGWWSMRPAPGGGTMVEFWLPVPPATGQ